ncbi:membrane protein [Candidatus Mancarchaeum acidiphilum]|uniref:Membrane protein n=1 Tax=Candidatus Mancarchaeum acidiphilum TaxID=1920749 RepID=A0A218NLY4_9ARCH|nr:hypothetical protein [Candidatus Mancarchaeum acidiphilum]ASI13483.1 membrane protein [Candidatus Mancarchaeum acidiphilum]
MSYLRILLLAVISLSLIGMSSSYAASVTPVSINASLSSYLSTYIPNSTIKSSTFVSFEFDNGRYIIMNVTPSEHILLNVTDSHYSFILNNTTAKAIITPILIDLYYPNSSVINSMKNDISEYESYSAPAINSCKVSTGLNEYTFTVANGGYSCETVPRCAADYVATGGMGGILSTAIFTFSDQTTALNNSYTNVVQLLDSLNHTNFNTNIDMVRSNISQISELSAKLPQSALFPLPSDIPNSELNLCTLSATAPYYCLSMGLCTSTPQFNFSYLNNINSTLQSLSMLPVSGSNLNSYVSNMTELASSYVEPVVIKEETGRFNSLINSTSGAYNKSVNESELLLSKFSNSSLSSSLSTLKTVYSYVLGHGINQNLTAAGNEINASLNNNTLVYSKVISTYNPVYNKSINTTGLVVSKELNYLDPPPKLVNLALQQEMLDQQFSNRLNESQLIALNASMQSVYNQTRVYGSYFNGPSFVKSLDSFFIVPFESGYSTSLSSKESSAPYYAMLLSFIIGIIVLFIIYYFTYFKLSRSKKIKVNKVVRNTWAAIFIVLFVIVLIYSYATYAVAASANSFLPFYSFSSMLNNTHTAYIALNKSALLESECANSIKSDFVNKTFTLVGLNKGACSIDGVSYTHCLSYLAGTGSPVIVLNSTGNSIVYKGLYGNILYVNGASAQGNKCYAGSALN